MHLSYIPSVLNNYLISLIKTGHEENQDLIGCSIIQMAKFLLKRGKKLPESENASFFFASCKF